MKAIFKKSLAAVIATISVVACAAPIASATGNEVQFDTEDLSGGRIKIVGVKNATEKRLVMPNELNGKIVSEIGNGSGTLEGIYNVETIVLGELMDEVTINNYAFANLPNLKTLSFPKGGYGNEPKVNVKNSAVSNNKSLETLHNTHYLVNIENSAFRNNPNLKGSGGDINLRNATFIGENAFANCPSVGRFLFGIKGTEENPTPKVDIKNYAFDGCKSATVKIYRSNLVNGTFGDNAFRGIKKLDILD